MTEAIWQRVRDAARARDAWTDEALARAAATLPEGADLRARLLVRDQLDARGMLARREVCVDGRVFAAMECQRPTVGGE